MSRNDKMLTTLSDKLKYLYKMELIKNNFEVFEMDIEFETSENTDGQTIIDSVNIDFDVDYDGRLDGYEPSEFLRDLSRMFSLLNKSISSYTPTQEGKIISGSGETYVDGPSLFKIEYEFEDIHKFSVSFRIHYY